MSTEQNNYEAWLTTIANTRLIFNTIEELEDFLEVQSIKSNGIKRCFTTPQRMRSAFRDLKAEVEEKTEGIIDLQRVMQQYQRTWQFYSQTLSRRSDPDEVALQLLRYCYPPFSAAKVRKGLADIFDQVLDEGYSIPMLVLMLKKALPGYNSKEGDATDISTRHDEIMALLERFTEGGELFSTLPVITAARDEKQRSRIMLLYHVTHILDTYESYAEPANIYDVSLNIKADRVNLDIQGFWNEYDGSPYYTKFWEIKNALDAGTYFVTHWHKSDNKLTSIRYTMFLVKGSQKGIIAYMLHPEAIYHRIQGQAYNDRDQAWYMTAMPDTDAPTRLPLALTISSKSWPSLINLTRVTEQTTIDTYSKWMETCQHVKRFAHCEYEFKPNIYAITHDNIYIPTGDADDEYYKVPKESFEGFDRITMDDNVGIMTMDNRHYIVFDEFLLYIPITPSQLKKYGINKVTTVD